MQRVAGAKAIPDAAGRTERRSRREHHPARRAGKVRADAPRDTRRTGYSPTQETIFALPPKGEYGGAGGVEGPGPSHPMPRAGQATCCPCRAAAAMHRGTPTQYDQDVLPFSKVKRSSAPGIRTAEKKARHPPEQVAETQKGPLRISPQGAFYYRYSGGISTCRPCRPCRPCRAWPGRPSWVRAFRRWRTRWSAAGKPRKRRSAEPYGSPSSGR